KIWNLFSYRVDRECVPPNGIYFFPSGSRRTLIAKAVFSKKGVEKVSFLPAFITPLAQPMALSANDPKFRENLEYMEWLSDEFPCEFQVEGNEVIVNTKCGPRTDS